MKEYFGNSAKTYKQTNGKQIILNPAISFEIPKAKSKGGNFLDVGCGNGDFHELASEKGYTYFGLDYSEDMVEITKSRFPNCDIRKLDARSFAKEYKVKFDIVLMSMIFTVFDKYEDIIIALEEGKEVLSKDGQLLVGIAHPCYDPYMQKGMLNRSDVEGEFTDYYSSGSTFIINKKIGDETFRFEDFHWTLADYVNAIDKAGLRLKRINECKPDISKKYIDPEYFEKKKSFPTFLLLIMERK